LESLGYYPVVRTSAESAWQVFHLAPQCFDPLIADLMMPDMSGDQLAHRWERLKLDFPVILCVGSSPMLTEEKVRLRGIADAVRPRR